MGPEGSEAQGTVEPAAQRVTGCRSERDEKPREGFEQGLGNTELRWRVPSSWCSEPLLPGEGVKAGAHL